MRTAISILIILTAACHARAQSTRQASVKAFRGINLADSRKEVIIKLKKDKTFAKPLTKAGAVYCTTTLVGQAGQMQFIFDKNKLVKVLFISRNVIAKDWDTVKQSVLDLRRALQKRYGKPNSRKLPRMSQVKKAYVVDSWNLKQKEISTAITTPATQTYCFILRIAVPGYLKLKTTKTTRARRKVIDTAADSL